MKQKIFISYSDNDRNKMRSVERLIKNTDDFSALIIADNRQVLFQLTEKVKTGIIGCNYFVPIITRQSINTQWLNQEIGFATAINRPIIPIVERQVIDDLKGFIHKQLDLSYLFDGNIANVRSEASHFTKVARVLINDILLANNIIPKNVSLENIFAGKWRSIYVLEDGRTGNDEDIELKDGNVYYVKGKPMFTLENVLINLKQNRISFKKVGIPPDNRVAFNELTSINLSKKYEGWEDEKTKIIYYRVE